MEAALNGQKLIWKLILNLWKVELEINKSNENRKTALHKAAYNNNTEIIELLLFNGADPKLWDENGSMPLDLCENTSAVAILSSWDYEVTQKI